MHFLPVAVYIRALQFRRSSSQNINIWRTGHTFCHTGPSAWIAVSDFKKTLHFFCLILNISLNISTSHITHIPGMCKVILQLMRYIYITYRLLTYLLFVRHQGTWPV